MSSTSLINPFLQARVLLHKSQSEVASLAGVSVSCVRYNEQGLFLHPIPKLTNYFEIYFQRQALTRNYYRFQRRTRQENKKMWLLPEPNKFQEPIRATFKFNGIGVTRFCKLFCCQSVLLYQPKLILNTDLGKIMEAAGFTQVQLQELHDRLQEHRELGPDSVKDYNAHGAKVLRDGIDSERPTDRELVGPTGYDRLELPGQVYR